MKNYLKLILYIIPFFICFHFLRFNSFCSALPDYIIDSSSLSVLEGGLSNAQEFGLSINNGNIYALPVYVEETLNPYLYQNYGFDLEDVANVALSPLDINGETLSGLKAWSSIDPNYNTETSIATAINNGFNLFQCKLQSLISTAKVLGTNAKAYVLGQVNHATNTVAQLSNNVLFKLGDDFSSAWSDNVSGLSNDNSIINMSTPNQILYGDHFQFNTINQGIITLQFSRPCYIWTTTQTHGNDGYYVNLAYVSTSENPGQPNLTGGSQIVGNSVYPMRSFRLYDVGRFYGDGVTGMSGYLYFASSENADYLYSPVVLGGSIDNVSNVAPSIENGSEKSVYYNYYTKNYNNESINISDLLKQLNGKYVTSDQLGQIKEIIDNQAVANTSSDSAGIIFSDSSTQDLIDLINGILNDQNTFEDSLGDPEPDPDPEPDNNTSGTGISVPPDYPTSTFDTLNDVISSPLEFFSIFEPIFLIFGSSSLMIFGMWLFVPCVLIIAFIIWALK